MNDKVEEPPQQQSYSPESASPTRSAAEQPWYQNWQRVLGVGAGAPMLVSILTIWTNFTISSMEMHNRESERAQVAREREYEREDNQRAFDAKLESERRTLGAKLESEQLDRLKKYESERLARIDKLEAEAKQRARDDEAKLRAMQTHYIDLALARTLCLDDRVRIFGYVAAIAKADEKAWAQRELDRAMKLRDERDEVEKLKREQLSPSVLEQLSRQLAAVNLNNPGLASATEADAKNRAKYVIELGKRNEALRSVDIPCTGLPSGLPMPVAATVGAKP
ncbi:hypothetical protein [Zoogloea sp.]|uniref:hypothetical protein n=1 Tax=Zoogloea sp. TaxID=49181 RepID=UPI001D7C8EF4|nr:hypothetical protein [Zoogloea sp.]MBK6655429.1 hypothetical protein [Zoogloea sp.]MBK7848404.1 hypothetical protein [Zoogloea sp.]HOY03333.1 hypothetical protein [Zoogloea sp.]